MPFFSVTSVGTEMLLEPAALHATLVKSRFSLQQSVFSEICSDCGIALANTLVGKIFVKSSLHMLTAGTLRSTPAGYLSFVGLGWAVTRDLLQTMFEVLQSSE